MTNPGDDQPLAPRRSLGKVAGSPANQAPQALPAPTYGEAPQHAPALPPAVQPAGRTIPAPGGSDTGSPGHHPAPQAEQPGQQVTETRKNDQKSGQPPRTRTTRRARLRLLRVDPWSVTKVSFMLSIAFGIMCVVAVFLLFSIMDAANLWDNINETIQGVLNQDSDDAFDINDYVGMDRVMAITMLIAAIDVVLITALATLGAFIYNMAAALLGGLEVTLAEDLK